MIIALVIGGIVWFDYIGLIDAKDALRSGLQAPGHQGYGPRRPLAPTAPALLEEERYAKRLESIQARSEELDQREGGLQKKDAEISQKAQELDDRGKAIDDQEKSFNDKVKQYDNRKANIDQNAQYLVGMPPAKAVGHTEGDGRPDGHRHLPTRWKSRAKAAGAASLVSVWLSGMPPDRSATLQRKMSAEPSALE